MNLNGHQSTTHHNIAQGNKQPRQFDHDSQFGLRCVYGRTHAGTETTGKTENGRVLQRAVLGIKVGVHGAGDDVHGVVEYDAEMRRLVQVPCHLHMRGSDAEVR